MKLDNAWCTKMILWNWVLATFVGNSTINPWVPIVECEKINGAENWIGFLSRMTCAFKWFEIEFLNNITDWKIKIWVKNEDWEVVKEIIHEFTCVCL